MERQTLILTIVGAIAIVGIIGFVLYKQAGDGSIHAPSINLTIPLPNASSTPSGSSPPVAGSTQPTGLVSSGRWSDNPGEIFRYVSPTYHYAFHIPSGFTALDYPTNVPGTSAVVVSDQAGDGLEVIITPTQNSVLTDADLTEPDVSGVASVTIGTQGTTGLSFNSANSTWDGSAAEVWFIKDGMQYEVSTNATNADLLAFVIKTWFWTALTYNP